MLHPYHKMRGFTLVELSIVLVIVGLLLGGIVIGRDMIEQSEANKVLSDVEGFRSAHQLFRQKYKCIPGDCDNSNFTNNLPVCNGGGNDDGRISGGYSNVYCSETADYWRHLREAGFINNQPQPRSTNGAIWAGAEGSYSPTSSVHAYYSTFYGTTTNFYYYNLMDSAGNRYSFLKVYLAEAIDKKIDDGNGTTGNAVGSNPAGSYVQACVTCTPPGSPLDFDFQNAAGCGNYNLATGTVCSMNFVIDPDAK